MSVTEQFSTGLTTIMAAAEQWYHRPLRKDAIEELMTMAERMGEAAPAIVINQKKGQMYDYQHNVIYIRLFDEDSIWQNMESTLIHETFHAFQYKVIDEDWKHDQQVKDRMTALKRAIINTRRDPTFHRGLSVPAWLMTHGIWMPEEWAMDAFAMLGELWPSRNSNGGYGHSVSYYRHHGSLVPGSGITWRVDEILAQYVASRHTRLMHELHGVEKLSALFEAIETLLGDYGFSRGDDV